MLYDNHHRHTDMSLLDAVTKIPKIVERLKQTGHTSVTITDHGTLAGTYKLWQECKKQDIKPILACECYCVDDYESESAQLPYNYFHLIVIAMNKKGWDNLKKLQEIAWEKGYARKPRVQLKDLYKYNSGLIITSACMSGLIGTYYLGGNKLFKDKDIKKRKKAAEKKVKKMKQVFGDRFYLEVQLLDLEEQIKLNKYVIRLGDKYKISIVLATDEHYMDKDDSVLQDIMICKKWHDKLNDPENHTYTTKQLWLKSYSELEAAREKWHPTITKQQLKKYCKETRKLAERIKEYDILPKGSPLPVISDKPEKELKEVCESHREFKRLMEKKVYKKRFEYEYSTICKLGFANYFLVVWDIAEFSRKKGIPYNSRGSVNGSLVSYLMNITWVDPVKFDCPFERFLTKDRLSLPDIDMDFSAKRRQEVVDYIIEKYGEDCVANISNHSGYKPRGVIKGVGNVLGLPFGITNPVTKKIKDGDVEWNDVFKYPAVTKLLEDHEDLADYAERMMGNVYQMGVHASGVVVTPTPLAKWCPIAYSTEKVGEEKRRVRVTEWDMYNLEDAGILKLDLLGLNTLDIIAEAIVLINENHKVPYKDFDELCVFTLGNLDDKKTFKMIEQGKTTGTFQLGTSDGMVELSKQIIPETLEDVCVIIALHRTAVLEAGAHTEYVKRRFGKSYTLHHEKMEDILSDTMGLMIYQEQASALAVKLAGFTVTEADHFRKGIKQKDPTKIKPWKTKFIKGCKTESKIDKETAQEIWQFIELCSGYLFNKSHSVAYAFIAYMTAYLKCHYPSEFMTSVLTHSVDDDDKLAKHLGECKKMGLKILNPEVNKSTEDFQLSGKDLLYPLTAVKQMGPKALQNILEVRKDGKYQSLGDFVERVNGRVVNIGVIINMVLAGCFRKFGSRAKMFDKLLLIKDDKNVRQLYCYDCAARFPISKTPKEVEESGVICPNCGGVSVSTGKKACKGKKFDKGYIQDQVFGFTLQTSKIKEYVDVLAKEGAEPLSVLVDLVEGEMFTTGFEVSKVKLHVDKNNNEMAFVDVKDSSEESSLTIFASNWTMLKEHIIKGGCYVGRFKKSQGRMLFDGRRSSISRLTKTQGKVK